MNSLHSTLNATMKDTSKKRHDTSQVHTTTQPIPLTGTSANSVVLSQRPRPKIIAGMADRIYVVAGSWNEYDTYRARQSAGGQISHYVFANDPWKLRGIRNPHGVFCGSWRNRPDIKEIVETLLLCSTEPNPALQAIVNELDEL